MSLLFTLIKTDYLQRTRSYAFLITVCASIAIAYTFVPEPNANYSTIRIAEYVGVYNSAWFGYVTAIMTSIFLSLIGFYLVNSGIKKDQTTKVGHIIAATPVRNVTYLFSKALSNFIVLLTIVGIVFLMSIVLFFLYNEGYAFELFQFVKPYAVITVPALFCIAVLAVLFEVCFGKFSILQQISFFFLFSALLVFEPTSESKFSFDVFGSKIVMHELEESVSDIVQPDDTLGLNIGYVLGNVRKNKTFVFNGMNFPISFLLSRIAIICLAIVFIVIAAPFFHRFNRKERVSVRKSTIPIEKPTATFHINSSEMPKPILNFSILPLLKTEFKLLLRKGSKWLWLLNAMGMVLLAMLPLEISYQIVLPIVWFLQVGRISDIATKEINNGVHLFTFSAYKPLQRVFSVKLVSVLLLLVFIALPLLVRLGLENTLISIISILIGGLLIVLFAAALGMISKGKKLFEVTFFLLTYANVNGIAALDYFGAFQHNISSVVVLGIVSLLLICSVYLIRRREIQQQ